MSVKNPNDPIGNQTHDLPICSAVPQPTAQSTSNVYRLLQYEGENRVGVVSTGNLETEMYRKKRCRKGSCSLCSEEKNRYLYCLNVKRLRCRERVFLNDKWLYINEEIEHKEIISCTTITELKHLGKLISKLDCK